MSNQLLPEEKRKRNWYYFHSAVTLLLTFGIGMLPPYGEITPMGMKAIGIFIGILYGWSTIEMLWPSLLGILAIGLTGFMCMPDAFKTSIGDNLTLQVASVIIFAAYMEKSGLTLFISRWFVSRKVAVGRPWVLSLMVLTSAFVLGIFTISGAAAILSMSFFYKILNECGYTKKDSYTNIMLFGICLVALLGAVCLPYQPISVIYLGSLKASMGVEMNPLVYFLTRTSASFLLLLLFWGCSCFFFRPDFERIDKLGDIFAEYRHEKMNSDQKIALYSFLFFLVALIIPANLPVTWPFVATLKKLGLTGVATVIFIALTIIHVQKDGKAQSIFNFSEMIKTMNWGLVLCIAITNPVATLLESDGSGVLKQFLAVFTPIMETLGLWGFAIVVVLFASGLSQISHNLVLARIITPMILPLGASIGINPIAMMTIMVLPKQVAVCTPGASGNAALIWGNTEWISRRYILGLCLMSFILTPVYSVLMLPIFLALFN